jgi:hypothetical protein
VERVFVIIPDFLRRKQTLIGCALKLVRSGTLIKRQRILRPEINILQGSFAKRPLPASGKRVLSLIGTPAYVLVIIVEAAIFADNAII